MKENKRLVITIGRQYGSGGREIGARLAKDLGLGFYDKNILRLNSDESGIKESFYHMADEKAGNKLLYRIVKSLAPELGTPSLGPDLIAADNLFRFQSEVIRKLAAEEDCVIIGRCADYVLADREDVLNIYLCADMDERLRRVIDEYHVEDADEAMLCKVDKRRSNYYQYYTDRVWGKAENYDLCINTGKFDTDAIIGMIVDAYRRS